MCEKTNLKRETESKVETETRRETENEREIYMQTVKARRKYKQMILR